MPSALHGKPQVPSSPVARLGVPRFIIDRPTLASHALALKLIHEGETYAHHGDMVTSAFGVYS